jgi:hypothetical protein
MLKYDLSDADPPLSTAGSLQAALFPRGEDGFTPVGRGAELK